MPHGPAPLGHNTGLGQQHASCGVACSTAGPCSQSVDSHTAQMEGGKGGPRPHAAATQRTSHALSSAARPRPVPYA
jgi:hypothetical protein